MEPPGHGGKSHGCHFVVQKHTATRLHYDFRLKLGGTLKSWALPKGFPFKHGEKHLAVHVEDHPLAYANFEGIIPKGQYGGGTVMLWDRGTFTALTSSPLKDLKNGKLHVELHGKKLSGEWYLVRLRKEEDQWLIIRGGDDASPPSARAEDHSVLSGKTLRQLSRSRAVWRSEPVRPAVRARRDTRRQPAVVEVMKALLVEEPPGGDWFYEIKFDGWRAIASLGAGKVRLISRNKKDLSDKFPSLVRALEEIEVRDAMLDGEIVALDSAGRSSFGLLQARELGEAQPPIHYYAFDLLRMDGRDLREYPIEDRKTLLRKLLAEFAGDEIRFSDSLGDKYHKLRSQAERLGLEGLIGKRPGSRYESGRRSGAWIKLKLSKEQELVIGGYTEPRGSRDCFGALLVGYYEGEKLCAAGKVGSGFSQKQLEFLFERFRKLQRKTSPFSNAAQFTSAELRSAHWLKPELVAQIQFKEWTRDGRLRQPVFLGLREDKSPREVAREMKK